MLFRSVLDRLQRSDDAEFAKRLTEWLRRELPGFLTRQGDKTLFPEFIVSLAETPSAPE